MNARGSERTRTLVFMITMVLFTIPMTVGQQPDCNSTYIAMRVDEGKPIGFSVVDFNNHCMDPGGGNLTYNVIVDDNSINQFEVKTGETQLKLAVEADAEAKLPNSDQYANPWTLRVEVMNGFGRRIIINVFVEFISMNDNVPTINNLKVLSPVTEDTMVGTTIASCSLEDLDLPGSGHEIPSVNISGGTGVNIFSIDYRTCDIILIAPLDYETQQSYSLDLTVYDNDPTAPESNSSTLNIAIVDVNDNAPACSFYDAMLSIDESAKAKEILITLNCTDPDTGTGGNLQYTRLAGSTIPELQVDKNTGDVMLQRDLDFDVGDRNMKIEVRVSDMGSLPMSSTVTVVFEILDTDDQAPVFTSTTFTENIPETADIGSTVLRVSATDNDSPNTVLSKVTYGFETPCTQSWFTIDSSTGTILVSSLLDWQTAPVVECQVYAYSSDKFADRTFANVSITIIAGNFRAPIFTQFLFEGRVIENAAKDTPVLTVVADDPDNGTGGDFTFSMPTGGSPFKIAPDTGKITVQSMIDFESRTSYSLRIEAKDMGIPQLSSQTYVNIYVDPVNECSPVFSNMQTSVSVDEQDSPGTVVTTLSAADCDDGDDGKIHYSLMDTNAPFVLERDSGALRVGVGLDRESTMSYTLTVVATDLSTTTPMATTSTLAVNIQNTNDNDPECSSLGPIIVTPNTNIDEIIGQLSCTDPDTTLQYMESGGDQNGLFTVDDTLGSIRLKTTAVEGIYIYTVTVNTQNPATQIVVPIEIRVETNLMFTKFQNIVDVDEATNVSDTLLTIEAQGSYDPLVYEIVNGNADGKFDLHQTTGVLRLVAKLDHETKTIYMLNIRASASSGQFIQQQLTVNVLDANDNAPLYASSFCNLSISEGTQPPRALLPISANDLDSMANAQIDYDILSGNTNDAFQYDSSGNLVLLKPVDYDTLASYTLVLIATDRGNPVLTGTTTVFIKIDDVDEHKPVFLQSGGAMSVTLQEDTAIGAPVIKINASDFDRFSELNFSVVNGNDDGVFSIDETTGTMYLVLPLDREGRDRYNMVIQVSNTNGEMNRTALQIIVSDVNDNEPVFSSGNFVFSVPHGTSANTDVGNLTVTDADTGTNKMFTLNIISGNNNNKFKINGETLCTAAALDANMQSLYELVVEASDAGLPAKSSSAFVTVLIEPEFKEPRFSPDSETNSFKETLVPGSLLHDANANAAGAIEGEDLIYSMTNGNINDVFYIEPLTGTVQLLRPFNFTMASMHTVSITAVNKRKPSLNDTFTLSVFVQQENKHSPIFTNDAYVWSINENAPADTRVGTISATDQDPGSFGVVGYSLEPNIYFRMDENSGVITVFGTLDYSISRSHNLYVTASDKAMAASRTSTAVVVINVIDFNNHAPVFAKATYDLTVPETLVVGSSFHVIAAEDLDSGSFGAIEYMITEGNIDSAFAIDSFTGTLILNQSLDFEANMQYTLKIEGRDGGSPALTGTATVTINIQDENDNSPQFPTMRVELFVESDRVPLSTIYTASALDLDAVKNGDLAYAIERGNSDQLFSIQSTTGEIKTAVPLDSANDYYILEVIAVDGGLPSKTGTVTVEVTVIPILNPLTADFSFTVNEEEAPDTPVGTVPRDPTRTVTSYRISGGNFGSAFKITQDGELRTDSVLDREAYAFYQLTVDEIHTTGIMKWNVAVTVVDINDNTPEFTQALFQVQMVENLAVGNEIGVLSASDADDAGVNSDVDMFISSSTPLGSLYFSLTPSGIMSVKQTVSFEVFSSISFQVIARDHGNPEQRATATVIVRIVDVNETLVTTATEAAFFKSLEFPDEATSGDVVGTISASDVNVTTAQTDSVRYTIVDSNSVFAIHSSTGVITLKNEELVMENARYYQWLIVTVSSGATTTSYALMIRLDTFNKAKHLITVGTDTDLADLIAKRDMLLTNLQALVTPPQKVKIWTLQSAATAGRRKLLATQSEALVLILEDESADELASIDVAKTFVTAAEGLEMLRTSTGDSPDPRLSSGTPPVSSVTASDSEEDDNLASEIIAVIVIGSLVALALLVGLLVLCYHCTKHRRASRREELKNLVNEENEATSSEPFVTLERSEQPGVNDADGLPTRSTTATYVATSRTNIN